MHSSIRFYRYFVFGLFLACNAVIITAAVWNLNLVQEALFRGSSLSSQVDAYMLFVGCAALALIIPVLFCELAAKGIFLVSVWFEGIWVGLFCIMELAGAAAATAAGTDELCPPFLWSPTASVDWKSVCASSRVLQAFSWICALLLLSYFVLLLVTCLLMRREDPTIWRCSVRRFPWAGASQKIASPPSPTDPRGGSQEKRSSWKRLSQALSRKSSDKAPTIACPRPRRGVTASIRRAIYSYRSGLSADYTIEHFRPEDPVVEAPVSADRPLPPAPLPLAPEPPSMTTRAATAVTFGQSLYPQHMLSVIPVERQAQVQIQAQRAAHISIPVEEIPRAPPSPSPVGDWPRANPSVPQGKRKSQRVPPLVEEFRSRQRQQSFPPLPEQPQAGPSSSRQSQGTISPVAARPLPSLNTASTTRPIPTSHSDSFRGSNRSFAAAGSSSSSTQTSLFPVPLEGQRSSSRPLPPTSFVSERSRPSGPRRISLEEKANSPAHAGSSHISRSNVANNS